MDISCLPYVPVYDIKGNFAGSKIAGTGNFQNVVAQQKRNADNYYTNSRIFGNLWGEIDFMKGLTFRTNLVWTIPVLINIV
jgi:hypothetical protein